MRCQSEGIMTMALFQANVNVCAREKLYKLESGNEIGKQLIFNGTNASKRWSVFLLPSDIDKLEEDKETKYYSDIYVGKNSSHFCIRYNCYIF